MDIVHQRLRPLAAADEMSAVLAVILVVLAVKERGLSAGGYGVALRAGGAGAFAGAMLGLRLALRLGYGRAFGTTTAVAVGTIGMAVSAVPMFAREVRTLSTPVATTA